MSCSTLHGLRQEADGAVHVLQHRGIGHEGAQARVEKALGGVEPDAPAGQDPGHDVVEPMALGERQGQRIGVWRQAGDPASVVPGRLDSQ
jgi:hypothetical protein